MDFVTHAAVGSLIGRALAPADADRTRARRLAALSAVFALLPDADHVLEIVSAEAYLVHHRTATHSLLFVAAATLAAGALGRRLGESPRRLVAVAGASLASHLLLDVLTPFGTGLLWPFSAAMATLDGLPIAAPWLLALCVGGAGLAAWRARADAARGRPVAWGVLAIVALALLGQLAVARRAAGAVPGDAALVLPRWTMPLAADAFVWEGDALVHYRVGPGGDATVHDRVPRERAGLGQDGPAGARAAALAAVAARPLARFRLPVATVSDAGVVFEDAQFRAIDPDRRVFTIESDGASYRVTEVARGLQVLVYLAVLAAVLALGRRRGANGDTAPDRVASSGT